jgi:hypothetical protein
MGAAPGLSAISGAAARDEFTKLLRQMGRWSGGFIDDLYAGPCCSRSSINYPQMGNANP